MHINGKGGDFAIKIKTRDRRIREYNDRYPVREPDATKRIQKYFADNNLNLEKACQKASEKAAQIIDKREYASIYICMREYPTETARPRTFQGHTYSPNAAANKQYFEKIINQVTKDLLLICTPAEIRIDGYMEMPTTVPPDEVILYEAQLLHVVSKPDGDNLIKAYLDMMTNVLTADDDIFYHMEIYKWYSLEPRVEIRIDYETAIESDYLYGKLKKRKSIKQAIEDGRVILKKL